MPRPIRDEGRVASAWILSIVGHLVAFGLTGLALAGSLGKPPAPAITPPAPPQRDDDTVEIDLPRVVDGSLLAATTPASALPALPLARGGGEGQPRPDMTQRGRGGTDTAENPALNLADRDEELVLSPELRSRFDRSQIQRIRSARHRASLEDWRASREPMELTFIASGHSVTDRPERRAPSDRDPSAGARDSGAPRVRGGVLGAGELPAGVGEARREPGGPVEGADRASPGVGVRDGATGDDHRASAKLAFARPDVQEGTPSIPAAVQGRASDTVDAEQEVALALQSIVHASNAGGAIGAGHGGQNGAGPSGSGGVAGPGSTSRALGNGSGAGFDSNPRDRRRTDYIRRVTGKLFAATAHAFPRWAAAEGLQGISIVTFTILANGSVASVSVTRPSGIPELDENCRQAVLRVAPLDPLPPEMGQSYRWAFPFDFRNPAVLPKSAKAHTEE
jgi:TonB family protein